MKYLLILFVTILSVKNAFAKLPTQKEVVESALKFYPKILEEEEKLSGSKANYISKKGAFDAKIVGSNNLYENGFYDDRYYSKIGVEKPLPFANSKIFTQYSKSSNEEYPLNNDSDNTLSDGRAKIGFSMSLLQGFLTNKNLTQLEVADLDIDIAKENLKLTKLSVVNKAKKAYYNYAIAKGFYDIALNIVNLRKNRLNQVRIQSKAGDKPKIDVVDSRRSLIKSQSDLINAKQNLESAVFALSIYYRDDQGNKIIIDETKQKSLNLAKLEAKIILPKTEVIFDEITQIKEERADIKIIDLKIKQEKEYLKLFKNQFLPELDLKVSVSKDFGTNTTSPSSTALEREERINVGVNLLIPLQTNKQTGLTSKSKAKINALKMKKRLIQDSIEVDIRSVYRQIINFHDVYQNSKEEVQMSKTLLNAEKEKFRNGDSDIITINIREQTLFLAEQKMLKSLQNILDLIADYHLFLMRE